jgi:hypothetical protein
VRAKDLCLLAPDSRVGQCQICDGRLEELDANTPNLGELHRKVGESDGQDDAGQTRARAEIDRSSRFGPDQRCRPEGIQYVTLADPVLVPARHHASSYPFRREERLESSQSLSGFRRQGQTDVSSS